jgi:signal transduction histidine kinase
MNNLFSPEEESRVKLLVEVAVALEERTMFDSNIVIGEGFTMPISVTYDPSFADGLPKGVEMSISPSNSQNSNNSGNKRYEAIGRMVTHMAHDINNMLNIITGNADVVIRHTKDCQNSTFIIERVKRIHEAAMKCHALTTGVVDYAHYGTKKLENFDVHEVLRSMINLMRTTIPKAIQINSSFSAQYYSIIGGTSEIEDVVVNIIKNAKDAMHEKGTLTITTANVTIYTPRTSEYGFSTSTGNFLQISFADSGLGMTEETRLKIFEPFFTTKEKDCGTGLGLNNVYNIVKSHGGFIEVMSKPAIGTIFDLYLPIADQIASVDDVRETEQAATIAKSDFVAA